MDGQTLCTPRTISSLRWQPALIARKPIVCSHTWPKALAVRCPFPCAFRSRLHAVLCNPSVVCTTTATSTTAIIVAYMLVLMDEVVKALLRGSLARSTSTRYDNSRRQDQHSPPFLCSGGRKNKPDDPCPTPTCSPRQAGQSFWQSLQTGYIGRG